MQSLCGTFLSHAAVDAWQIKGDGTPLVMLSLVNSEGLAAEPVVCLV